MHCGSRLCPPRLPPGFEHQALAIQLYRTKQQIFRAPKRFRKHSLRFCLARFLILIQDFLGINTRLAQLFALPEPGFDFLAINLHTQHGQPPSEFQ